MPFRPRRTAAIPCVELWPDRFVKVERNLAAERLTKMARRAERKSNKKARKAEKARAKIARLEGNQQRSLKMKAHNKRRDTRVHYVCTAAGLAVAGMKLVPAGIGLASHYHSQTKAEADPFKPEDFGMSHVPDCTVSDPLKDFIWPSIETLDQNRQMRMARERKLAKKRMFAWCALVLKPKKSEEVLRPMDTRPPERRLSVLGRRIATSIRPARRDLRAANRTFDA